MARNPAAQTAFGPMVLAAVEQNEPPGRRLVDDDLADLFLPRPLRWLAGATRSAVLRRLLISASEWSGRGLWANLACRKRFIGDKLDEALGDIDAVVILGAGLDTRAYRLTRRVRMPVFEVDLPVNIARKAKTVRRVLGELPLSVRLVALDFEHDDLLTALAEHGYRTEYRVFFVCEGVTLYHTVRQRRQLWHFGLDPEEVAGFLADYGWRLTEQAGPEELVQRYVEPTGRNLNASQIEWSAYAEKSEPVTPR